MNLRIQKLRFLAYLLIPAAMLVACGDDDGTTTSDDVAMTDDDTVDDGSDTTDDDTSTETCDVDGEEEASSNTEIVAMTDAMIAFRDSLSDELLEQAGGSNCLDNDRVISWVNTPNFSGEDRAGIIYDDLTDDQLSAFKEILQLFLSTDGYEQVQTITEEAEAWLEDVNPDNWSPGYYSIDLFGDPETSGSWGFQLDGHHCAINFLVSGDNVSMVPAFLAGEPAEWNAELAEEKGTGTGYDYNIFEDEKVALIAVYNAMTDDELALFVSDSDLVDGSSELSIELGAFSGMKEDDELYVDPYAGTEDFYSEFATGSTYADMETATQELLVTLMKEHVYNLTDTFADVWWADIESNINSTYFQIVTVDGEAPSTESQFYYRIYNPYLWVEFNTENSTGQNASTVDNWNHIHSITRIPSSPSETEGDYGVFASLFKNGPKTLLEHHLMADHHANNKLHFDYKLSDELKQQILENAHAHSHSHRG